MERGVESGERAAGNGGVARKTRGIGILANEETDLIGWKPMPLFPAPPVEKSKSKGTLV